MPVLYVKDMTEAQLHAAIRRRARLIYKKGVKDSSQDPAGRSAAEGRDLDNWLAAEREIRNSTRPVYCPPEMKEVNFERLSPALRHAVTNYFAGENYKDRTERADERNARAELAHNGKPTPEPEEMRDAAERKRLERIYGEWLGILKSVRGESSVLTTERTDRAHVIERGAVQERKNDDWYRAERMLRENPKIFVPLSVLGL